MKTIIIFWGLLFGVLLSRSIHGEDLVFSGVEYPPFYIQRPTAKEPSPKNGGIIIDLLMLFSKEHPEYQIDYKKYPAKRASKYMVRGEKIDISFDSPIFVDETELAHYDFTETVAHTEDVVIIRKDSTITYNTAEDLYGLKIAVIRGFSYGEFDELHKMGKIKYHVVNTHEQTVRLLTIGRVDAVFGNIHVSPYVMKKNNLDISDFKFSQKKMFEFDLALLVNKKTVLLPKLNQFIKRLKHDGTLVKITHKYTK